MINQLTLAMEELRPYYRRSENEFVNEDCLQSAFLEALERVQDGYEVQSPKAFLKALAYRKACDTAKAHFYSKSISLDESHIEHLVALPKRTRKAFTKACAEGLKPAMRTILELILEGYTYQEIDSKLGKKEGYSKLAIFRLRKALQRDARLMVILEGLKGLSDVSGEYSIYSSKAHEPDFEPDKEDMNPYIPIAQVVSDTVSPWYTGERTVADDIPRVREVNPKERAPMKKRMYRDNQNRMRFIGVPDQTMDHEREINAIWPIR